MVTEVIKDLVENEGKKYDVCVAIGPMIMMKFVCRLTKELGIPTTVSYTHLPQGQAGGYRNPPAQHDRMVGGLCQCAYE